MRFFNILSFMTESGQPTKMAVRNQKAAGDKRRTTKGHVWLGVFPKLGGWGHELRKRRFYERPQLMLEVNRSTRAIRRVLWMGKGLPHSPDRLFTVGNKIPSDVAL